MRHYLPGGKARKRRRTAQQQHYVEVMINSNGLGGAARRLTVTSSGRRLPGESIPFARSADMWAAVARIIPCMGSHYSSKTPVTRFLKLEWRNVTKRPPWRPQR